MKGRSFIEFGIKVYIKPIKIADIHNQIQAKAGTATFRAVITQIKNFLYAIALYPPAGI